MRRKAVFATAMIAVEAPWAAYCVLGAVGPRVAPAAVPLSLEIDRCRL